MMAKRFMARARAVSDAAASGPSDEAEARAIAWRRMHAEMLEAGGIALGHGLDHSEEGTGIALNPQEGLVLLLASGVYKSYDYEDVREWRNSERAAGIYFGDGHEEALPAETASLCNADRQNERACLLVSVRDREIPIWRISMSDKIVRARWMEILREEIDELPTMPRS